ncbi:MAG: ATP-binding cassette domain-containing protein [Planctomycetes bacterium]|nr:ATP-binding cassette domain-containing protein [Planctomycetota bacterium]
MIEVDQVTKRYGPVTAVDGVSFKIEPGEIVGFLGPNGAGKSTLLKMISTWLEPTAGHIRVAGHDTKAAPLAVRRSLGYLPEHNALYEGMRVDRFLAFVGAARGVTGAKYTERLEWVVEKCSLQLIMKKRVFQCSKGNKQRIGVAAALLHDPNVIILDEPTHGLDPLQVVAFRDFIREMHVGRSVLFSSHIVAEVLSISERILVIHYGKLLLDAKVTQLAATAKERKTDIETVILNTVRKSGIGGQKS